MVFDVPNRSRVKVRGKTHLKRNSMVEDILTEGATMVAWHGVILYQSGRVADPVRSTVLDRLPDGREAKCFASMDGDVEVATAQILKRIVVMSRWVTRFIPGQIESNDTLIAKTDC